MATLASLVVNLEANTARFHAGLKKAGRETDSFRGRIRKLDKDVFNLRNGFIALGAATGVVIAGRKILELGAAVEETASKYQTVFGPAIDDVNGFINENARLMGLTTTEARELLATTGAVVQGFGATKAVSADLSTEISTLAADIASFNNAQGGAEQVTRDIIGALGSEREALKKYGIVITETMVQRRAMAETGKKSATALTQLEKATATVALITERAGVAVGDLVRTQDSAANKTRRVMARMRELRDTLASALVPAIMEVISEFDGMTGEFESLSDAVTANQSKIAAWARFTIEAVKFVGSVFGNLVQIAFNVGQAIGHALMAAMDQAVANILDALNKPAEAANFLIEQLNRIPGVDIDFRIGTLDAQTWFDRAEDRAGMVRDAMLGVADAVGDIGTAWTRMAEAADRAQRVQQDAVGASANVAGVVGGGGADGAGGTPKVKLFKGAREAESALQSLADTIAGSILPGVMSLGPLALLLPVIKGTLEELQPVIDKVIQPLTEFGTVLAVWIMPALRPLIATFRAVATAVAGFMMVIGAFAVVMGDLIDRVTIDRLTDVDDQLRDWGNNLQEQALAFMDSINATNDFTDALSDATTNIPRALPLEFLRQQAGRGNAPSGGSGSGSGSGTGSPSGGEPVGPLSPLGPGGDPIFNIVINTDATDGATLVEEMESELRRRWGSGTSTVFDRRFQRA